MHELLPDAKELRVNQQLGRISADDVDKLDLLLLILPETPKPAHFRQLPDGARLAAAHRRSAPGKPAVTRLDNSKQTLVIAGFLKPNAEAHERLSFARKLVAAAIGCKPGQLGIAAIGFSRAQQGSITLDALSAALAAGFSLPTFKAKSSELPFSSVRLLGLRSKLDVARVRAEAKGNNLARWLTALPPNKLDARNYAAMARDLARRHGWQFTRYSTTQLEKLGAGAFLAVAQGNADNSASIVRLRYRPKRRTVKAEVALVGKGIIFDTGGTNLKPFQSMLDMHGDMQGSAVALGTLLSVSTLKLPYAVDCWLAITENRTGPTAYKSQDVVTAANGKTIQTIHTDAEGRMALADTLVLASREKPGLIIDYATLTGTCISAVTTRYSGVFTNREEWHTRLQRIGVDSGERVWPFPIGKEFLQDLDSPVADLMQCSPNAAGDHILAGSFLAEFIDNDVAWLHMDLAASNHKGGLAHIPTEVTGFGVRYTMSLLMDAKLHEAARG
ncbi:MAG: leucyl aminopeptidase family protein [Pseudomonadota bacterium]